LGVASDSVIFTTAEQIRLARLVKTGDEPDADCDRDSRGHRSMLVRELTKKINGYKTQDAKKRTKKALVETISLRPPEASHRLPKSSKSMASTKTIALAAEPAFITLPHIIDLLLASGHTCHYCSSHIFTLYYTLREKKQWTIDRLDNSLGHVMGNCVVACLECNLKRRVTDDSAFLFTKRCVLSKLDYPEY